MTIKSTTPWHREKHVEDAIKLELLRLSLRTKGSTEFNDGKFSVTIKKGVTLLCFDSDNYDGYGAMITDSERLLMALQTAQEFLGIALTKDATELIKPDCNTLIGILQASGMACDIVREEVEKLQIQISNNSISNRTRRRKFKIIKQMLFNIQNTNNVYVSLNSSVVKTGSK